MKSILSFLILFVSVICMGQNITAEQLLKNTINYHDPEGNWEAFNNSFSIELTMADETSRSSDISINLPEEIFSVNANRDGNITSYTINKGKCDMAYNGSAVNEAMAEEKNMSCERAKLFKNYYTYLYGLPMKLYDPGTIISETVEKKTFKGKDYLVLEASYDEAVGSDIWYFYLNPETYALEVYQFYKTDENGEKKLDSGEYILLSEEMTINGIKLPKIREWYYNKDDQYLGTDTLVE